MGRCDLSLVGLIYAMLGRSPSGSDVNQDGKLVSETRFLL